MEKNEPKRAITLASRAVEENPASDEFRHTLGVAYFAQGKLTEARSSLDQAVQLDPGNAKAHFGLGIVQKAQGEAKTAISSFRSAIRADPKYIEAHSNLGALFFHQGQFNDAIITFREALRLRPKSDFDGRSDEYVRIQKNLVNTLHAASRKDNAMGFSYLQLPWLSHSIAYRLGTSDIDVMRQIFFLEQYACVAQEIEVE